MKLFCINITRWKKNHIKEFIHASLAHKEELHFISSIAQAKKYGYDFNAQLISWSSKDQSEVNKIIKKWGGVPWYVEDGFIRSTGLGTDLTAPASIVLDRSGIYYDPNSSSDLESLLQNKSYSSDELHRAERLKNNLLENQLSKYNVGNAIDIAEIERNVNQSVILIPGQVEGDASIKKGCVDIRTNTDLVEAVRKSRPNEFLIYKPHPDVVSGNRKGKVAQQITDKFCDLVLEDSSITDCLEIADEVHTMTSLVGFEGLMRELKVVCYGLPFYSNWGLTEDRHQLPRRDRKISLNELIAATLIDYPLYMNWQTGELTTPEVIVEQLKQKIDEQGGKQANQVSSITRMLRKVKNFTVGVIKR